MHKPGINLYSYIVRFTCFKTYNKELMTKLNVLYFVEHTFFRPVSRPSHVEIHFRLIYKNVKQFPLL